MPDRRRLGHPGRLREVPTVEQESQQFRPLVPAPFTERREQQVAPPRPEPALLVAREEAPPLGGEGGIRILGQQLAEPEPGGGVLCRFRDRPAEPANGFQAPAEERKGATELMGGSWRRTGRVEDGFEDGQGSLIVVLLDSQPRALQNRRGGLAGHRRTKDAARLRRQAGLTELCRELHPGLVREPLIKLQQFGDRRPHLVVPAQHGEQPGAERQAVRFRERVLENDDGRRVVEESHVRLGAQAEQRGVRSVRSRRIQSRESRGEIPVSEQLADLGQQARVRLRRPRHSSQQQSECEGRHGRRSATVPVSVSR